MKTLLGLLPLIILGGLATYLGFQIDAERDQRKAEIQWLEAKEYHRRQMLNQQLHELRKRMESDQEEILERIKALEAELP